MTGFSELFFGCTQRGLQRNIIRVVNSHNRNGIFNSLFIQWNFSRLKNGQPNKTYAELIVNRVITALFTTLSTAIVDNKKYSNYSSGLALIHKKTGRKIR
ncbi:MAG: hypothetical protein LBG66_04970 [Gallionellaceae bacterium]|jgi:uncharacterized protein (DUF2225 family)|nr:hypothetical protein [Gallionellaceae bacterium]